MAEQRAGGQETTEKTAEPAAERGKRNKKAPPLVADDLYPSDDLYPADDLFPG
ncbi:hypothetical protein [Leifsonia sp. AG29]|uniref:hypothetical protein n=1 Tax=Leifsonia sp. AG29 TaxID=2598860 RepID=UPI00131DF882|nr:hypothetical protein [Leifsonia sp. AG29]